MINLVPAAGLKAVKNEYWLRVVSVWLLLFGTVCLVGTVFLLPSYISLSAQIYDAQNAVTRLHDSSTSFDLPTAQIVVANNQAQLLTNDVQVAGLTTHIASVDSYVQSEITVTNYALQVSPDSTVTFTISGQADSRAALVAFRDSLEGHDDFLAVTLPLSNLISNQDIPFSLDIVIATSTTSS